MSNKYSVLPGFGISLGFTVFFLSLMLIIPIAALALKTATVSWNQLLSILLSRRLWLSLWLSFGTAFFAAVTNAVFGLLLAWVLTRYRFPGQRILDALIDLPFAMPTAVAGIALTTLYSPNGMLGKYAALIGLKIAFTPLGIWVALTFVGIPFVVRALQPVIRDLEPEVEEAAASLGANRLQTFLRVVLPYWFPVG